MEAITYLYVKEVVTSRFTKIGVPYSTLFNRLAKYNMSFESNRSLLMAMCEHMQVAASASNGSLEGDDEATHLPNCDLMIKAINNYSDFMEINDNYKQPPINTTKLVVLTIIIFFTVVGNFGVVLAILLRR